MDTREFATAKAILVLVSLLAGGAVFAGLTYELKSVTVRRDVSGFLERERYEDVEVVRPRPRQDPLSITGRVALAVATALLYPVVASVVLAFCAWLRKWAYRMQVEPWDDEERLMFGAVWPLTLVACIIVFVFVGIIHRVF